MVLDGIDWQCYLGLLSGIPTAYTTKYTAFGPNEGFNMVKPSRNQDNSAASKHKALFALPDGTVVRASPYQIDRAFSEVEQELAQCGNYAPDSETLLCLVHAKLIKGQVKR